MFVVSRKNGVFTLSWEYDPEQWEHIKENPAKNAEKEAFIHRIKELEYKAERWKASYDRMTEHARRLEKKFYEYSDRIEELEDKAKKALEVWHDRAANEIDMVEAMDDLDRTLGGKTDE